jgi:rare lipoprotein A (peptidoglycan hydrolase)
MKKIIASCLFFTLFIIFPAIITFAQDIQQGNATWYEDDSMELNASHARLPPGTRLRVTNLNNQKEVYVTVTDRIQNSDNRILDLSQEAASLLGMNRRGNTPVRLVVIRGLTAEPASPDPKADDYSYDDEPEYNSVPEITAVSTPDYENDDNYVDYSDYPDYADEYTNSPPTATASVETPQYNPPPASSPPQIRTFPNQSSPEPQSQQSYQPQPGQTAQPQADAKVLLKKLVVIINGKEQIIDIPDGVYIPLPAQSAPSTPAYTYPPSSTPSYTYTPPAPQTTRIIIPSAPPPHTPPSPPPQPPPRQMPVPPQVPRQMPVQPPVQAVNPVIKIIPQLPDPNSGKVYRIQVAAYAHAALAQVCFDRLKAAGFNPAYEQNGSLYRVVLSGIKAADVSYVAQRLSAVGFFEAWIREESKR